MPSTREARACYYVYRMTMGAHAQTGIALTASVQAYDENRVRKHELTRPEKENDRVRNIEALGAETGPVLCAFKSNPTIDGLLARGTESQPLLETEGPNAVVHTLWRIGDSAAVERISNALNALDALYIADGHHRSAAASRVAAARRAALAAPAPEASYEYFLSVAFPSHAMRIYDYNRVVADLNGASAADFLAGIEHRCSVEPSATAVKPARPRTFGLYLAGRWFRLRLREDPPADDPVAALDVSLLQTRLIEPLLGIGDPRTDPRIDFVGGIRGLSALEQRVDSGRAAAAFALYPTSMDQLMAVADAAMLMPPKSTWFEPKLADGLLSHVLD
jgi:uncharacterized protein (DUF1015 family)